MDLKELSAKYIGYHNNPLIKVDLPTSKLFLEDPREHKDNVEKFQNILGDSLKYVRVDRRCARSKGIWIDDRNLCKITKLVGPLLKNFGFQDKRGIFLLPEEALFLLEQNRLDITLNNSTISIYEAYNLLLNKTTLKTYRVYKKLVGQGFKLLNKEGIKKFYATCVATDEKHTTRAEKRFRTYSDEQIIPKVRKISVHNEIISHQSENVPSGESPSEINFNNIFMELRNNGPQLKIPMETSKSPNYFGFLPSSVAKHRHDFNLYIRDEINPKDIGNFEDVPNIIAICCDDNIAFYRFPNVDISLLT
ncbi:hypothetical protein WA026_001283 [Henosepilachna vigintioctopunctata]|uniref:tRNA-splicing endonuclease subunit Sen54 N-terminal domain-containing protein n=1 Tax=Henosepilachna vigintioctopunctata TaxID=420089 RepID=A0AAW1UTD1_9CUCU